MAQPFDPEILLVRSLMAMLATSAPAGPRIAPMGVLSEDEALWLPSDEAASSVMRLRADPNAAAEIVEFDPGRGVLLHLGLRGAGGCLSHRQRSVLTAAGKVSRPRSNGLDPMVH
ncbi:MAG: pyridoxamine 5'-phosphate oxidase family protein [Pseudomonadota bacterium]